MPSTTLLLHQCGYGLIAHKLQFLFHFAVLDGEKGLCVIERFAGADNKVILNEALRGQRLVQGDEELAAVLQEQTELVDVAAGQVLIEQGASDNDIFLLLAGRFEVIVNGRKIAERGPGEHVGEMAATVPSLPRSATVRALESGAVAKLSASALSAIADHYPRVWRQIARTLADRLYQRNALVRPIHEQLRIFVISSTEGLKVAYAIQEALFRDPFNITVWTDGVFRASQYPVESLVNALDASDFAVAVVQPDDVIQTRGEARPVPRDNVLFELGLFIGHLGRHRSLLVEPSRQDVKLPSDLSGISTLRYNLGPDGDLVARLGAACNQMRKIFNEMGPK